MIDSTANTASNEAAQHHHYIMKPARSGRRCRPKNRSLATRPHVKMPCRAGAGDMSINRPASVELMHNKVLNAKQSIICLKSPILNNRTRIWRSFFFKFHQKRWHRKTSPPQSHLGRARRYPHVGECTLPLRVLAVYNAQRHEAVTER